MDELENDALSLLLILDDNLFPQFLEWAGANGWADLVLFLLETDTLRFRIHDEIVLPKDKISFHQSFHLIWKNGKGCFNKIIPKDRLESLKRLTESQIPFNAVFSQICDLVWADVIKRGRHIHSSPMWSSIRRSIVEQVAITPEEVLEDSTYRKYLERYLQRKPADLASLQCWVSVRRILTHIDCFLRDDRNSANANGSSEINSDDPKKKSSFMRRWRTSSTAVKSANKTLQTGSGSLANSSANKDAGDAINSSAHINKEYTDPFEAFKILLEGTRSLQKQFFPVSVATSTSSGGTYVNPFSKAKANNTPKTKPSTPASIHVTPKASHPSNPLSGAGRSDGHALDQQMASFIYGGNGGADDDYQSPHHPSSSSSSAVIDHNCSGLSESLRMELAATLSLNSTVRTRDIETVDQAFAFACANILEKLLRALETETHQFILRAYEDFQFSTDFAQMVASQKANTSPQIAAYIARLEFLSDRVRHEKKVHWNDSVTGGKMYMFYEQAASEIDGVDCNELDAALDSTRNSPLHGNSVHDLLSTSNLNNIRGLAVKVARINSIQNMNTSQQQQLIPSPLSPSAKLRRDNQFNTSGSGWRFAQTESFLQTNDFQAVSAQEQMRMISETAFSPNIMAVSLEFFVPEAEPVSHHNIQALTSHLRMWVGGASYRPKAANERCLSPKSTAAAAQSQRKGSANVLGRKGSVGVADGYDSEGGSGSDNDLEEGGLVGTNNGADIDFDLLMAGTAPSDSNKSAAAQHKDVPLSDELLKGKNAAQLDLVSLDLERLDRNFNKHLFKSSEATPDNKQLSLKQLVSALVLSLVAAQDCTAAESERFEFQSEETFSFVVDSRGLQNLSTLVYSNKVTKQSVSEFKTSFLRAPNVAYLERPFSCLGSTQQLYNVSICIKSSLVDAAEQVQASQTLLHAQSPGGSVGSNMSNDNELPKSPIRHVRGSSAPFQSPPLTGIQEEEDESATMGKGLTGRTFSGQTLVSPREKLRSHVTGPGPRYRSKVNIGMSFSPVNPRHSMLTLLKNLSLQAYYQSVVQAGSSRSSGPDSGSNSKGGSDASLKPKKRSKGQLLDSVLSSPDLVSLNSSMSMRNLLCGDTLADQVGALSDVNENHAAMRAISLMDKSIAVSFGVETLYDIYMGASYLNVLPSTLHGDGGAAAVVAGTQDQRANNLSSNSVLDLIHNNKGGGADVEFEYCYPIMKHLGVCDFSLCAVLSSLSMRQLLQILMLLLTDQSVVLISSNITLLTKLQTAIPRLIWPFRIHHSHNIVQLQSSSALQHFLTRNDPVPEPLSPPSRQPSPALQETGNSTTLKRMLSRINSNMSISSNAPAEGKGAKGSHNTSHNSLTLETPPAASPVRRKEGDEKKSLVLCVDAKVFAAASASEKAALLALRVKKRDVTAFDLDACTLVTTAASGATTAAASVAASPVDDCANDVQNSSNNENNNDKSLNSDKSKLSSETLFKSANFDIFRELFAHVTESIDEHHAAAWAQQGLQTTATDLAQLTKRSNAEVEKTFYLFWTELVLRALPRNIQYFHSSKVLSCDVKCLLSELLSNMRASMACSEEEYLANKAAHCEALDAELVHFLTVEEFVMYFNEQRSSASNALLHEFYKAFLLDESPVFADLLRRHCKILEYWAF